MEKTVSSFSSNPPVLSLPETPTSTSANLISVVMDKFQVAMNAKETTLNLQKETLQTIVDDMNLLSDKLDELKVISNWDSETQPFNFPYNDLIGMRNIDPIKILNKSSELIAVNQQLKSAGFKLEVPNVFITSFKENSSVVSKLYVNTPREINYNDLDDMLARNFNDDLFYYTNKPDPSNPGSFFPPTYFRTINGKEQIVDFQPFRVADTEAELTSWKSFSSSNNLPNLYTYPFFDLVGLPLTSSKVKDKIQDLITANSKLNSAGMSLGPTNAFCAIYLQNNKKFIVAYDNPPKIVDSNFRLIEDGFYAVEKVPSSGMYSYKFVSGTLIYDADFSPVRIPTSQDELTSWNKFTLFNQSSISSDKIFKDPILLASNNINGDISVNFNMAFIKQANTTSSPYTYSINAVSPENKSSQPKGTFFYLTDDINNPKTYYLSSGSGAPSVVPASDISLFINNPSDIEIQSWRTQYAEKQIQLTQRSTEFQAFLNSTVAEFNTYSDLFTNVLKTIFTSLRDIASRL